jgi:hypothetical protein
MDIQKLKDLLSGAKQNKAESNMSEEVMSVETDQLNDAPMPKRENLAPKTPVNIEPPSRSIAGELDTPDKPKPKSQLEMIQDKMNQLKTDDDAKIAEAKDSDYNRMLLANAIQALGTMGQAELQRKSGVSAGIEKKDILEGPDTVTALKKDRDSRMKTLQDELKFLQSRTLQKGDLEEKRKYDKSLLDEKRAYDAKIAEAKASKTGGADSEFTKALHKKQAADFANSEKDIAKTSGALSKIDEAIDAQMKYTQGSIAGTGPLATLGGLTKYMSTDTENLEAKFKAIDLKNMVSTFSGMSKAVDSEAERQAWKATQASVSNDDSTNMQILLGSKSSMLKDREVAKAKAQFVKDNGNLDGFTHPVLEGDVTTLVDLKGQMVLVDKSKIDELKKKGFKTVDEEANFLINRKEAPGEDIVERNGKNYKWNPRTGTYQIIK